MIRAVRTSALVGLLVAAVGLVPGARAASPAEAARGVLERLLPARADRFTLEVIPRADGRDVFEIESRDGRIVLRGSDGVAICSALNWYLKYHCHASVSWTGDQLELPDPLPAVEKVIRRPSPHQYRYFFNYCAFSYSLAWWDWPQWERMIDWMALNGVNAPLAITGQEATWQAVYRGMGLTDREIAEFMVGPGYLPFGWMGCMDGWGGPLGQDWIDRHRELQIRILARERELGMTPVLQGFTGHVPRTLQDHVPGLKLQQTSPWAEFPATRFIDPLDPMFRQVGKAFLEEQAKQFGTDHLYASDTFIEMTPPSSDPGYLADMGRAVYEAMKAADPQAVWFLQGWIFFHNSAFWKPPQARGLFSGVPEGRLVLIDMTGDSWRKTEAFYGQPWVWTLIQDFGDVVSLHGDLAGLVEQLEAARRQDPNRRLRGLGIIMEGLGYNTVFNDLLMEMTWHEQPPAMESWLVEYAHRRYGRKLPAAERAWALLLRGPHHNASAASSVICARPRLDKIGTWTLNRSPHGSSELVAAIREMLACAGEVGTLDTYRFDLVHMTRQALADHSWGFYGQMMEAFRDKDRKRLAEVGGKYLELIRDLDDLLATRREFLLGTWIADARRWGTGEGERRLLEWNARNQLTLWGPKDSPLNDYAHKQWSGLVRGFYLPRWQRFIERLDQALAAGREFDVAAWEQDTRTWEEQWTHGTEPYATRPSGDPLALSRRLFEKWLSASPQ